VIKMCQVIKSRGLVCFSFCSNFESKQ